MGIKEKIMGFLDSKRLTHAFNEAEGELLDGSLPVFNDLQRLFSGDC